MNKNDIVQEYIEKFPDHGCLTLARLIYKEHPDLFTSVDTARSAVRYRQGKMGTTNRKNRNVDKGDIPERAYMPPKSLAKPLKPFALPDGKTLILSDVHIPYQDEGALEVALDYGRSYKPDNILLNGDVLDFFAVSRWEKNPEERNLAQELQLGRQFLAYLRQEFPDAQIIFKIGNHEERWEKYLWHKAPELCGVSDFKMESILRFGEYGVRLVEGRQKIKAGKNLTIIHGHEIPGAFDPVNFARTLYLKLGVCAIGGHKHKTSEHSERDADEGVVTCWSVGCLEELHPAYMPINKWNHGFATVELDKNKFYVQNYRIVKGKIY